MYWLKLTGREMNREGEESREIMEVGMSEEMGFKGKNWLRGVFTRMGSSRADDCRVVVCVKSKGP